MAKSNDFQVTNTTLLSFEPIVLLRDVMKNWLLILVVAVTVGVGAYIITDQSYRPVYQTNTTMVITSRGSSSTVYSNLQNASNLASVFTELLNSSVLQKKILEELGMSYWNYDITASAIAETNLLTIKVTASDPRTAFLVMQALVKNHGIVTYDVVGDLAIEILQLPTVPRAPMNSANNISQVEKAVILSVIASCAFILLYSYFNDTVRSRRESDAKLKCWCLAEIRHEKKTKTPLDWILRRKNGLIITNPGCSFQFVESIRKLRRRVEQYMGDGRVLMVSSVAENEGKSTIAVNLAISMAKKHHKVLLIDMDFRKPACYKIMQYKNMKYGCRDVISGMASLSDAVVNDPLSGLDMLLERYVKMSSGRQITNMVADQRVAEMIETARSQYDYIILDLPPLQAAPDAEFVMQYADASLLVVQQNLVRASTINKAITSLQKGKAELIGCVLNNVFSLAYVAPRTAGTGYGYGYGHYGNYGKNKKAAASTGNRSGS